MRRLPLVATAVALLTTLSAPASAETPKAVIRFGVASTGAGGRPFVGGVPVAVAHARGLLEREFARDGVRVEWSFFKGLGPAANEALANDLLDFVRQGELPGVIGRASGLDTKLLLVDGSRGNVYLAVPAASSARSVADLRGKRVVVARGSGVFLAITRVLAGHGLKISDVVGVDMDGAAVNQALAAGTIDGAFGGSYFLQLQDQGLAKVIYTTKASDPAYRRNYHVLVAGGFERKHADWVQRVVNVLVDAHVWASDEKNRDKLFELWSKSGSPASNFKAEFDGDALEVRNSPLFDPFLTASYQAAVTDAVRFGLIRARFDVEPWIDRRYLDRALAAKGLTHHWPTFDAQGRRLGPTTLAR